jgi:Domain of unknown function (DUF1707)
LSSEEFPPLRIGHAERTAAQKALDEHLTAGRLGIDEYADRSAAIANAVVAADLAAQFVDLPEPHPQLPGSVAAPTPMAPPPVTRPNAGGFAISPLGTVGLAVVVAVGLVLITRQPASFMLFPLAAAVLLWVFRR